MATLIFWDVLTAVWHERSWRMVRLLVRKSLLSAWTSSRWYGRRRAAHGSGRCLHRRTVAAAASAARDDDDEGRDIRLGVLFFSCCDSSDGTSCYSCCCCVTDEECRGKLPATSSVFSVLLLVFWRDTSTACLMVAILAPELSSCLCLSPVSHSCTYNDDEDNNHSREIYNYKLIHSLVDHTHWGWATADGHSVICRLLQEFLFSTVFFNFFRAMLCRRAASVRCVRVLYQNE